MRILYLTNGFPYPLTSGYLRHYFLIRELAQSHSITLLSLTRADFVAEHTEAMSPFTERVLTFTAAANGGSPARKALNRARRLAGRDQAVREMCAAVERITAERPFDVVLFSGRQTFPVMRSLHKLPVVVDLCDAASVRLLGTFRHAGPARKPMLLASYLQMRRVERRLMRGAEHLLFISCRDRDALVSSSDPHTTIIPNGIDVDYWKRSTAQRGGNTIVFTGGMDYPPNTDAAFCLIQEVLPLVRRTVPDAKLLLVGRDPPPRLIEAGRQRGVTVTGFVDDVRPYLEQATVFAGPLRFGAGVQNKVLEAMAMEVPVVTSPIVAEGLRTEEGEEPPVQIARDRQQFAAQIAKRLTGHGDHSASHLEARRFVEQHYRWKRSGEKLEKVIDNVLGASKG